MPTFTRLKNISLARIIKFMRALGIKKYTYYEKQMERSRIRNGLQVI